MNLTKIKQLRDTHSLVKYEFVSCERNFKGKNPHFNVTVKNNDSSTNFNILESDNDAASYIDEWANEVGIEMRVRTTEVTDDVFQSFNDDQLLDDDTLIWKYMDLSKFMSLVSTQSLWFARLDKNWEVDPLEGKVPKAQWQSMIERTKRTNFAPHFIGNGKEQFGGFQKEGMVQVPILKQKRGLIEQQKKNYDVAIYNSFVTCWNISPSESYHMWKLYCNHHNGIAIKSTIGRLKTSLGKGKNYSILGGLVEYLDYESQTPRRSDNFLSHVFCKTMPYSFENELRLCFSDNGYINDVVGESAPYSLDIEEILNGQTKYRIGFPVKFNLNTLIEEIIVSPHSDPWFQDLVNSIIGQYRTFPEALDNLNHVNVVPSGMK